MIWGFDSLRLRKLYVSMQAVKAGGLQNHSVMFEGSNPSWRANNGEVAEWSIALLLKSKGLTIQGFESLLLRMGCC
jgi:hypothetical protein